LIPLLIHTNEYLNTMERITFSIPDELKRSLARYPDINWPMVVKKAVVERLNHLEEFERHERWQA